MLQCLPRQRERPRLCQPGRREALRRSPPAAPRTQPAGQHLRPGLLHPCESKCAARRPGRSGCDSRHQAFHDRARDSAATADHGREAANAKKKIAVIGGGPAGLSCAYFLARLGYKPVIFEKEPTAGGMLVQAIPSYRLPREELGREVGMIESMGVTIQTGKTLGKDFTLQSLKDEGYEAVFLGVGAPQGVKIGVLGEEGEGVIEALSFLAEYNVKGTVNVGKKVVVIGAGNSAIDAARTALRLGAEKVTILYRRTRAQMPAWAEEVLAADEEGIEIKTLVAPKEIVRGPQSEVRGVVCTSMAMGEFDASGRRRSVPSSNPDYFIECDQVIGAIGQSLNFGSDSGRCPGRDRAGLDCNNGSTGKTSVDWVFSGGDAATGPQSVVSAVGAGDKPLSPSTNT